MIRRLATATALTVAATLAATGCAATTPAPAAANPAPLELVAASEPTAAEAPSPAGCRIIYVANPHYAESVPGAVKVNAKSEVRLLGEMVGDAID